MLQFQSFPAAHRHTPGEVVFENHDIFGDAVNIASRLAGFSSPAGIFVSESVKEILSNKHDIRSEFVGLENLKNVKGPDPRLQNILQQQMNQVRQESQRLTRASILPGL